MEYVPHAPFFLSEADAPAIEIRDAAHAYLTSGLCPLPAVRNGSSKRPDVDWKRYQSQRPTFVELECLFHERGNALCLVCGAASHHLEVIDFDLAGAAFDPWQDAVEAEAGSLLDRCVVETTPSGGRHVIYRCMTPVSGNLKLAQRRLKDGSLATLIETRGEGGVCLVDPSPGYRIVQGDLTDVTSLTPRERDVLLRCAADLNEVDAKRDDHPPVSGLTVGDRPGDIFNREGDVRDVLHRHGWRLDRGGENEHWTRPGKGGGTSATLKDRVFYVFSSNAAPFEPGTPYSPFAVYALLEHAGDFATAAKGLGGSASVRVAPTPAPASAIALPDDPGPVPTRLLSVPGFVGEVMDHSLATAPYPNPVLAFCGALALQGFLAGRVVRDPGDNRTNFYLLGLAYSASGKDWPRRVNARVLRAAGLTDHLGDRLASGEGIQDAMAQTPTMLFQTDEIDGLLRSINGAKDARHESIMSTLLSMYSSASSVFAMRRKAGEERGRVIDQPCLVLFGTAIPERFYEALSERMLTNGLFARTLVLESGPRSSGQEPRIVDLPDRVVEAAADWARLWPTWAEVDDSPTPRVVPQSDAARRLLVALREEADRQYAIAERRSDTIATTVWGRAIEHVRKLALAYAVSEDRGCPRIGPEAVRWASDLTLHQVRRMLFMAAEHSPENAFDGLMLKALRRLREAPGGRLSHSELLRRMKLDAHRFRQLMETLIERGEVVREVVVTSGRNADYYALPAATGEPG